MLTLQPGGNRPWIWFWMNGLSGWQTACFVLLPTLVLIRSTVWLSLGTKFDFCLCQPFQPTTYPQFSAPPYHTSVLCLWIVARKRDHKQQQWKPKKFGWMVSLLNGSIKPPSLSLHQQILMQMSSSARFFRVFQMPFPTEKCGRRPFLMSKRWAECALAEKEQTVKEIIKNLIKKREICEFHWGKGSKPATISSKFQSYRMPLFWSWFYFYHIDCLDFTSSESIASIAHGISGFVLDEFHW